MPNTAQAIKRVRQDSKRRLRNRARLSRLRSQIKKFRAAIAARNVEVAEREYREVSRLLDQTAKTNTIHKNAANRKKSRLAKQLNQARVEHG